MLHLPAPFDHATAGLVHCRTLPEPSPPSRRPYSMSCWPCSLLQARL